MTPFTTFIETLRRNGVCSIGLEFHPPQTVIADEKNDTTFHHFGTSIELPGVKFVKIDFFEPQTKASESRTPDDDIRRHAPLSDTPPVPPKPVPEQPKDEPTKAEPLKPSVRPEAEKAKTEPEPEPEKPKKSGKAKPESKPEPKPENKSEAEFTKSAPLPSKPANVYDVFVETVEQDDGTKSELKRSLIGQMTLDDMLRVNNDFQLGLDTDVATEALRAELLTCFA